MSVLKQEIEFREQAVLENTVFPWKGVAKVAVREYVIWTFRLYVNCFY